MICPQWAPESPSPSTTLGSASTALTADISGSEADSRSRLEVWNLGESRGGSDHSGLDTVNRECYDALSKDCEG